MGLVDLDSITRRQKYPQCDEAHLRPGRSARRQEVLEQLNGTEKKILRDSCAEACEYERKASRDLDVKVLAKMKAKGLIVNDISAAERARMRDKVKPVIEKYTTLVGLDLVKQAYAEIEPVRKQK